MRLKGLHSEAMPGGLGDDRLEKFADGYFLDDLEFEP